MKKGITSIQALVPGDNVTSFCTQEWVSYQSLSLQSSQIRIEPAHLSHNSTQNTLGHLDVGQAPCQSWLDSHAAKPQRVQRGHRCSPPPRQLVSEVSWILVQCSRHQGTGKNHKRYSQRESSPRLLPWPWSKQKSGWEGGLWGPYFILWTLLNGVLSTQYHSPSLPALVRPIQKKIPPAVLYRNSCREDRMRRDAAITRS